MGMNTEREAEAMRDLRSEKRKHRPREKIDRPPDLVNWRHWERTHDFPTYDGDSGLQNYQQTRCEFADIFSSNLRRLITDGGETLEKIGAEIGLAPGTLWMYLANKRVPRLHVIQDIAAYYNIEPAHLILSPLEDY